MLLAKLRSEQADTLISFCCGDVSQIGFGGKHRTQQLQEILFEGQAGHPETSMEPRYSRSNRMAWGLRSIIQFGLPVPMSAGMISQSAHVFRRTSDLLDTNKKLRLLILEGTGGAAPLMIKTMRRRGKKSIILPQNLESLVPDERAITHTATIHERLKSEVEHFKAADGVFCISQEEQWLLNLMGVKADYLPYHPPQYVIERTLGIRHRRVSQARGGHEFLLLGNVSNPPTLKGFNTLYEIISKELPDLDARFHVAGAETETLRRTFLDKRFHIHGTVTTNALADLMVKVTALIIHQAPTSGTLTRLVEARFAGLPVIGNPAALKSAREKSGVSVYADHVDLLKHLQCPPGIPEIPSYPEAEVQRFLRRVEELLAK